MGSCKRARRCERWPSAAGAQQQRLRAVSHDSALWPEGRAGRTCAAQTCMCAAWSAVAASGVSSWAVTAAPDTAARGVVAGAARRGALRASGAASVDSAMQCMRRAGSGGWCGLGRKGARVRALSRARTRRRRRSTTRRSLFAAQLARACQLQCGRMKLLRDGRGCCAQQKVVATWLVGSCVGQPAFPPGPRAAGTAPWAKPSAPPHPVDRGGSAMSAEPWALDLLLPAVASEGGAHGGAGFDDGGLLLPELPDAWAAGAGAAPALRCLEPSHGADCTRCGVARNPVARPACGCPLPLLPGSSRAARPRARSCTPPPSSGADEVLWRLIGDAGKVLARVCSLALCFAP